MTAPGETLSTAMNTSSPTLSREFLPLKARKRLLPRYIREEDSGFRWAILLLSLTTHALFLWWLYGPTSQPTPDQQMAGGDVDLVWEDDAPRAAGASLPPPPELVEAGDVSAPEVEPEVPIPWPEKAEEDVLRDKMRVASEKIRDEKKTLSQSSRFISHSEAQKYADRPDAVKLSTIPDGGSGLAQSILMSGRSEKYGKKMRGGGSGADAKGSSVCHTPQGYYPPDARRRGSQGAVVVALEIAGDGEIRNPEVAVSSGDPVLDDAASAFFGAIVCQPTSDHKSIFAMMKMTYVLLSHGRVSMAMTPASSGGQAQMHLSPATTLSRHQSESRPALPPQAVSDPFSGNSAGNAETSDPFN